VILKKKTGLSTIRVEGIRKKILKRQILIDKFKSATYDSFKE
jgi:hypothetical protein